MQLSHCGDAHTCPAAVRRCGYAVDPFIYIAGINLQLLMKFCRNPDYIL